jgi:hypothetical protein
MDITKLFGLPAHPLLVHIPIVLIPLTAVGALAIVAVPAWRARFGWILVGLSGVALVGVQLALMSGEGLESHVEETKILERHTEMADSMRPLALALFVVILGLVWLDTRRRAGANGTTGSGVLASPRTLQVVSALVVVLSLASTVRLAQIGHNGAKASWDDVNLNAHREDHDDDGD